MSHASPDPAGGSRDLPDLRHAIRAHRRTPEPMIHRGRARRFGWGMLCVVLASCTSTSSEGDVEEVQDLVSRRLSLDWERSPRDPDAIDAARDALLAADLDMENAVRIALLENRRLRAAYARVGVARADLVQAGLLKNPVLDGNAKFFPGSGEDIELDVAWAFLDVFFIPLRTCIAESKLAAVKLEVAAEVIEVAGQVERAFVSVQADQQILEMRRTVMEATEHAWDMARRLRAAGNLTDLDLAREQALHEESRLELREAEVRVENGRERLTRLLGLWGGSTLWHVGTRLPEPDEAPRALDDLERPAIAASLELAANRHRIEAEAQRAGLAGWDTVLGDLEIGAAAQQEVGGDWGVGPAVSVPIPIFDFGQASRAAAAAELSRRLHEHYAIAVETRSKVRAIRAHCLAAQDRAVYVKKIVLPLAERVLANTMLHYNAMQVGVFELIDAKRRQIDAGREWIESLRDCALASIELRQALRGVTPADDEMARDRAEEDRDGMRRGRDDRESVR
jgi:outer membrane protein, heavy metal efflux system